MNDIPYVSVIIPVYNDPDGVKRCLKALQAQQYPSERFEIIVVDNNSTPPLCPKLSSFPGVRCLVETKRGSYAARNRGIRESNGEVVAFTDADCIPDPAWIQAGVSQMCINDAKLIGGKVEFIFQKRTPNTWEYYDANHFLDQEKYVHELGIAATANLFVERTIFDRYGTFNRDLMSGGDVEFTRRASRAGETIEYAENAVVHHPARSTFKGLLRKVRRVYTGMIESDIQKGKKIEFPSKIRSWIPTRSVPNPGAKKLTGKEKIQMYFLYNAIRFTRTFYNVKFYLRQSVQ